MANTIVARLLNVQQRPARVWRGGSGPALVLLHGGLGDARLHWEPVWDGLANLFTITAPDLPGFGETAPLAGRGFGALVDWLSGLLEVVGFPRAVLVGNSFGAGLARLYAARHPVRVVRLVLVNGGSLWQLPAAARVLMKMPGLSNLVLELLRRQTFSARGLQRAFAADNWLTPEIRSRCQASAWGMAGTFRQLGLAPLPAERLPHCPTLLLWGERDRLMPPVRGKRLARELNGARFLIIPAAGHLPQLEQPELFINAVRAFASQH